MRGGRILIAAALAVPLCVGLASGTRAEGLPPLSAAGPEVAAVPDSVGRVLVLDEERLFLQSLFGKASIARENAAARALEAENTLILADLIAEEQSLTDRRDTLPAAEFTALADAFDAKAERIRREQDAKLAALVASRDADRETFLRAIGPILNQLLQESGAAAILDVANVLGHSPRFDITDQAIERIDAVLTAPAGPGTEAIPE